MFLINLIFGIFWNSRIRDSVKGANSLLPSINYKLRDLLAQKRNRRLNHEVILIFPKERRDKFAPCFCQSEEERKEKVCQILNQFINEASGQAKKNKKAKKSKNLAPPTSPTTSPGERANKPTQSKQNSPSEHDKTIDNASGSVTVTPTMIEAVSSSAMAKDVVIPRKDLLPKAMTSFSAKEM